MALEDIVNVQITTASATPSRPSFGTALALVNKVPANFTNRVREYGSLAEIVAAGWTTSDAAYLIGQMYFGQNPRPRKLKIGRRANKTVQSLSLKCLSAVQNDVYTVTVAGVPLTYTVGASATTTTVATAIELLIEAVTGVDSTSAADVITFGNTGAVPGTLIDVADWSTNFSFKDLSADPGVAADLAACQAETNDWYGLLLDSQSQLEVVAAAAWLESSEKMMVYSTSDTGVGDSVVTNDVMSTVKASAYLRTIGLYDANRLMGYGNAGWMGQRFTADPGSDTWAYKTIAGLKVDSVSSAQRSAILAKNGNIYSVIAGLNVTENGKTAGGEWADVIRFLDWIRSELRVQVFFLLVNTPKVPYTDTGIESVVNMIKGVLTAGVKVGGIADDTPYVVTAPKASEVDAATRATRVLPGVTFSFRLAGAVHIVNPVNGTVGA